jgi:hypothetical protein
MLSRAASGKELFPNADLTMKNAHSLGYPLTVWVIAAKANHAELEGFSVDQKLALLFPNAAVWINGAR